MYRPSGSIWHGFPMKQLTLFFFFSFFPAGPPQRHPEAKELSQTRHSLIQSRTSS